MMKILWAFFVFIISTGVLVTVHEYGHFLTARYFGVCVKRFSIGFGKVIWVYKSHSGIQYTISLIPLGGYVEMLDEQSPHHSTQPNLTFNGKSLLQRVTIVLGGPAFNIILSLLL